MREVRYAREQARAMAALGIIVVLASVAIALFAEVSWIAGCIIVFVGAVIAHICRLPLQESDVLLRLTADRVWTKELGWRRWTEVETRLYKRPAKPGQLAGPGQLEIRLPHDANRRFIESIGTLDIDLAELEWWLRPAAVERVS